MRHFYYEMDCHVGDHCALARLEKAADEGWKILHIHYEPYVEGVNSCAFRNILLECTAQMGEPRPVFPAKTNWVTLVDEIPICPKCGNRAGTNFDCQQCENYAIESQKGE